MKCPWWVLGVFILTSCTAQPTRPPAVSTQPATEPASAPHSAAAPAGIDAEGYLQPVDPFEVRIRPKAYGGELTIIAVAANGSPVKGGDILLSLDPEPLNRQLAAAKNELTVAQANLDHAEAEAKISTDSEALALRQQQDAAKQADDAVKWWETVDGPQMLREEELNVKQVHAMVDDAEDELNQLKKMYKSEELTNATADIVVRRSLRSLEINKARLEMTEKQADKFKTFHYPVAKQRPLDAQKSAHLELASVQLAQARADILRKAGLITAQAGLDDAQRKVNELQGDAAQLTVRAPADGVVVDGAFAQGAFQGDPRALRIGERVAPQQVLMTVYMPGKLVARFELPEAKFAKLHAGQEVNVQPDAYPALKLHGVLEAGARAPTGSQSGPVYAQTVSLEEVDPQLVPGSRVKLHVEQGNVPSTAESKP